MQGKLTNIKGYGSFFSYIGHDSNTFNNSINSFLPTNRKLFYSGRHAIKYIIETIKINNKINTFWIPEYYCQHVTSWLKKNYNNIKTYKIDPLDKSYVINASDFAKENDVVLVNNFWGISKCLIKNKKNRIIIIEDHSHGWLSNSCINSTANFCFSSLRKSVPVPLAGLAWIPNGKKMPSLKLKTSTYFDKIWNIIEDGMKKKLEFEENSSSNENLKNNFLELVYEGENMMHNNYDLAKIDTKHEKLIELYLKNNYLHFKEKNFKAITRLLKANNYFKIVDCDSTPFGLTLHFQNVDLLNRFKKYLISKNIYPSVLWPNNNPKYGYFINIHIDYRYNREDIKFIVGNINNYVDTPREKLL